jgi:hypothetical protein
MAHLMNARIVANGARRLRQSPELEAKLQALWTNIHARYAEELARSGFFRRRLLKWKVAAEYRHVRRHILPSAQSLYFSRVITENASPSRSDVDVHD